MNYTQERRITQLDSETLIVGADIAKQKHVARAQDNRGVELGKRLLFENSRPGFLKLLNWLTELQETHGKSKVVVGVEPTGQYWLPFAAFAKKAGIKVVVVNPMHVKKIKELDDNSPTKNDVKDAKVIAQLVKDGRYSEPNELSGVYAELRVAFTEYERLKKLSNRIDCQVQNWLDRYFPEYLTVFKDWQGKASIITLKNSPLPQDIVKHGVAGILSIWKRDIHRAVGVKRARQLVEAAQGSIGIDQGLRMASFELKMLLEQYDLVTRQIEELLVQIQELLKQIPGTDKMLTIPGVGWLTIAGFLAEIGDLQSYAHPKQIIKLAGLNLKENSSGKHKGKTTITKRGRPRLRALLYRCVLILVCKNPEFKQIHQYLTTRPTNPLKKKQSLIALCGKLIRILFTIGRKHVPYDPKKVVATEIQPHLQLIA